MYRMQCLTLIVVFLFSSCSSDKVCDPGRQLECTCPGGLEGSQKCLPDGSGWDECDCMTDTCLNPNLDCNVPQTQTAVSQGDDVDKDDWGDCCDCDDTDPDVNKAAQETCNDIDDDCDGTTDNMPEYEVPRCLLFKGVCKLARKTCDGVNGWIECGIDRYGPDYEPTETSCDHLDNDCDGTIDEGCDCALGSQDRKCDAPDQGECDAGLQSCEQVTPTEGEWGEACVGAIPPVSEQCNHLDDDCDGMIDEDFDLLNDSNHCGQCNNACSAGLRCYDGRCLLECPQGFYPSTTDGRPVCISILQAADTPCDAFANCAAMTEGGQVGYGGDGWTLPDPLPAGFEGVGPTTVWTQITEDGGILTTRYLCLSTTTEPDGGGTKACPDCNALCEGCVPEDCPASLPACGQCGCSLQYWCHVEI